MPVREVIEIDETLCNGCGECVTACAEGAIAIVDGVARLVSDTYCDGLGACLGHCPQGALTVVRREAEAFDEAAVEERLNELEAGQRRPALLPLVGGPAGPGGGCPGSRVQELATPPADATGGAAEERSFLGQWPVQLHLLPPVAPFLRDADLLLAADCVAYAVGGFHPRFLAGHALAIACPKLDSHQEIYLDKLVAMIDDAGVRSLTVMVMEVPCCGGLVRLVEQALARANRSVPVTVRVVGVRGDVVELGEGAA